MIALLNQKIEYFTFASNNYKGVATYTPNGIHKARVVNKNILRNGGQGDTSFLEKVFTTTCTLKKKDCKINDKIIYNSVTYYVRDVQEWIDGKGQIFGCNLILEKDNV